MTLAMLGQCRAEATKQGIAGPMPVLQGWTADDYLRHAEAMRDLPALVGLGSVCRRSLGGPDGLLHIIAALDRHLPRHVGLHLFGVKGAAIAELAGHPRIASVDSMAWDYAARREKGEAGYTVAHRTAHLRRWYAAQTVDRPQLRMAV
jgi:hypothetical protein